MSTPFIPDFLLICRCGCGVYGDVWLGKDRNGLRRAVKVLDKVRLRQMGGLEREERALKLFRQKVPLHPGLIQIFHVGETDQYLYYVMEMADNFSVDSGTYLPDTLAHRLGEGGAFSTDLCLVLMKKLLAGVWCLHDSGLVHRDIKPSNIVFVDGEPKLADVGLTASQADELSLVGTAHFMPPERSTGTVSDLYALGKVLYCMISGESVAQFPSLPEGTPMAACEKFRLLNKVVLKACSREVGQRFATVEEFTKALNGEKKSLRTSRKLPLLLVIVGVIVCAGLVVAMATRATDVNAKGATDTVAKGLSDNPDHKLRDKLVNEARSDLMQQYPTKAYGTLMSVKKKWPRWAAASSDFYDLEAKSLNGKNRIIKDGFGTDENFSTCLRGSFKSQESSLQIMEELWEKPGVRRLQGVISSYVSVLAARKMYKKAHEVLGYMFKIKSGDVPRLALQTRMDLFTKEKRYGEALKDSAKLLSQFKITKVQRVLYLADIYRLHLKLTEWTNAIADLEMIKKLDPSQSDNCDSAIRSLKETLKKSKPKGKK